VVALVLAFAIEMLQPAARPRVHRHHGDERPHVHAGTAHAIAGTRLGGGAEVDSAPGQGAAASDRVDEWPASSDGITATRAAGVHMHVTPPVRVASSRAGVDFLPHPFVSRLALPRPEDCPAPLILSAAARGPPAPQPRPLIAFAS